jgi:hypothetical protein
MTALLLWTFVSNFLMSCGVWFLRQCCSHHSSMRSAASAWLSSFTCSAGRNSDGGSSVRSSGGDLAKAVSRPCDRGGRASPVSELRSLPSESCVRRRPCPALLRGQRVRVRCTPGSGWQSRVYPASVRTLPRRRSTLGEEMPSHRHDTTDTQFSLMQKEISALALVLLWTFVLAFLKCPAGAGSCGHAVPAIHLCGSLIPHC